MERCGKALDCFCTKRKKGEYKAALEFVPSVSLLSSLTFASYSANGSQFGCKAALRFKNALLYATEIWATAICDCTENGKALNNASIIKYTLKHESQLFFFEEEKTAIKKKTV